MKKALIVLIVAVLALGAAFAQPISEKNIEGATKVVFLNNAFEGLALSSQVYNAKEYHKAYSLGEILDQNLWFQPKEGVKAQTVAFTDFYTDENPMATFRAKYVSFVKDNPAFDYDLFVGQQQKESYDVKYKGYCIVGSEAFIFVLADGWNGQDLFENMGMVAAENYEVTTVDGSAYILPAAALKDVELVLTEDKASVNAVMGDLVVEGVKYVVPQGLTKVSEIPEEGVVRATVFLNADGVYGVEAPYAENRAGTIYSAWSVADLFEKFGVKESSVKCIGSDGYTQVEDWALFTAKYIAFQDVTAKNDQKDYFTLGKAQPRNGGVTNVAAYVLDDIAFAYIPREGITIAEVFAKTGAFADAFIYKLTYADGRTELVDGDKAGAIALASDSDLLSIEKY